MARPSKKKKEDKKEKAAPATPALSAQEFKTWENRLVIANSKFKKVKKRYDLTIGYYRNRQWYNDDGVEITASSTDFAYTELTVDNMIYSNIKTIVPSINIRNPKIYVKADKKPTQEFDSVKGARSAEILVNHDIKRMKVKRQVNRCIYDALIFGWGIVETGFTLKTQKEKDGELLEVNESIQAEEVFAVRISPYDFRIDPEAIEHNLDDAAWVAKRWVKNVDDVKTDDTYKNTSELKSNITIEKDRENDAFENENEDNADNKRLEGWDIWDKVNHKLITIVLNAEKEIQFRDWPLDVMGFPFETIFFNENPNDIYPLSDAGMNVPRQNELNRMRSLQLDHVKRLALQKYISKKGAFTLAEKAKLMYGPAGTIAETSSSLDNTIKGFQEGNVAQDIYITIRSLQEGIRQADGVAQFEQGVAEKFDTARESELISQGVSIRRAERRETVEDFYSRIAKKIMDIRQQTLGNEDIPLTDEQLRKLAKLAGQDARTLIPWLSLSKKDIQGDYSFSVETGSTQPVNAETRKRDVIELTAIAMQVPDVDKRKWFLKLVDQFEDMKDIADLMKDPEQLQQEQQAAIQSQLQAESAKDQPKIQADLQRTQMKNQTALQKTSMEGQTNITAALIAAQSKGGKE